ncbi:hypothetical protein SAMN05660337_0133 [Maridesulfovibrio ferrireducens]|uniref:Uncharacterized protein n=1 Tax=Maridesulfovibrio ferrireducens TaxID=246191 RepID=A0A1G9B2Z3_9BACT|nr:hypothetical protein [Maridesulfovibrio ferrireducens]SDK33843.1 hypothetical protein SAMN05660337_0133 [Maridesulfovibrio ferrireducens]
MNLTKIKTFAVILCLLLSTNALASELAGQTELSHFQVFSQSWVTKLNRSHIKGIQRMEILPRENGAYLARYHAIDPGSIKCIVKRTSSKKKGLIGLLKYIETVYESTGKTPEIARNNHFTATKRTRITEIFSNTGKGWR